MSTPGSKSAGNLKTAANKRAGKRELICTIKNGELTVDTVGFVGTACADDVVNRELKALGKVKQLTRKKTDKRPVHDTSVVDVSV